MTFKRLAVALVVLLALGDDIAADTVTVAFSPNGGSREAIARELAGARQKIDVALFFLGDHVLIETLCAVAAEGRVTVRLFANEAMTEPAHRPFLERLAQNGVQVFHGPLNGGPIHLKCAVIDGETVITGAANWTEYAFQKNYEDSLIIHSPGLAAKYQELFDRLEKQCQRLEWSSDSVAADAVSLPDLMGRLSASNSKVPPPMLISDVPHVEVFFSPGREGIQRFFDLADRATNRIDVGMYLFDDDEIIERVGAIARRGIVKVRILCDQSMTMNYYLAKAQKLYEAGAEILYWPARDASMHMKCAVVDGHTVFTGSANWTRTAMDYNAEDMVMIKSDEVTGRYLAMLDMIAGECQPFARLALRRDILVVPDATKAPARAIKTPADFLPVTGVRTNFDGVTYPADVESFTLKAAVRYLDDEEYHPVLMELLRTAHQSILVTMYAVPERKTERVRTEAVLGALCLAASRGVYVYVVLNMPPNEADALSRAHTALAERLRSCGVDARLCLPSVGIHDKLVVIDLCKVLVGSHNWSEGALTGDGVYEASALLVLPKQDERLADYILSRGVVSDMRSRDHWEREINLLRHLGGMNYTKQQEFLESMDHEE